MKKVFFLILCCFILASRVAAAERIFPSDAPPKYQYLKPKLNADNKDFREVYHEEEVDGIWVICSMNVGEVWLNLNCSFTNKTGNAIEIDLPRVTVKYKGSELFLYEGRQWESYLGLNELQNKLTVPAGQIGAGMIYAAVPQDFFNDSEVFVTIPFQTKNIEIKFIFEPGWMNGESYRKMFQSR